MVEQAIPPAFTEGELRSLAGGTVCPTFLARGLQWNL